MASPIEDDLRHAPFALIGFLTGFIIDRGGETIERRPATHDIGRAKGQNERCGAFDRRGGKRQGRVFGQCIIGCQRLVKLWLQNWRRRRCGRDPAGRRRTILAQYPPARSSKERERNQHCGDRENLVPNMMSAGSHFDHRSYTVRRLLSV